MFYDYGMLTIFSIASITQLLSIFGISIMTNMLVWGFGVGLGGSIFALVYGYFYMWTFEAYWADGDSAAANTASTAMASVVKMQNVRRTVMSSAAIFAFVMYGYDWMEAQYYSATPEEQKAWDEMMYADRMADEGYEMDEKMEEEGEEMADEGEEMFSLFRF